MHRSLARTALGFLSMSFAPAVSPRPAHRAGFVGDWRGSANLPASMDIDAVRLRLVIRPTGHATCLTQVGWMNRAITKVRGRGWIFASGRCARWSDEPDRSRVIVHTIARLSDAAAQVTFDLYLPDGSELFGYATIRSDSKMMKTSF